MRRSHLAAVVAAIVSLVSCIGCGSGSSGPTGTISGKLLLNGKAPPAGSKVQFLSEAGAAGTEVSADGSFTIMGVPVGDYKVMVTPGSSGAGGADMDPMEAMKLSQKDPNAFAPSKLIPAKFMDIGASGISFQVKEGTNDFALDMKE